MSDQRFRLTWNATPRPEGLTKSQIPEGHGACDAMVVLSLVYPPDGSVSMMTLGLDGRTGEPLPESEIGKAWTVMAMRVAEMDGAAPHVRALAERVVTTMLELILSERGNAH